MRVAIGEEAYRAVRPRSRYLGMMFRDFSRFDCMVFEGMDPRKSLWTPFCPMMDMIFVRDGRVANVRRNVGPWRVVRPRVEYDTLIESKPSYRLVTVEIGDRVRIYG